MFKEPSSRAQGTEVPGAEPAFRLAERWLQALRRVRSDNAVSGDRMISVKREAPYS